MIRVYLVDDHKILLPGLKMAVETLQGFTVTGQATDGLTAVREMVEKEPDICICDLSVPLLNGFGIIRRLKEEKLKTKVILLTSYSDDGVINEAMQLQVAGYLLKENSAEELDIALENVAKGYRYFTPRIMTRMVDSFKGGLIDEPLSETRLSLDSLTAREKDVLSLVISGLSGKEIADNLNISEPTMKTHKSNILKKLHVKTTRELILLVKEGEQLPFLI